MEKQVKEMNVYVANLAVANVKFHNLHWNIVGQSFPQVHEHYEEVYNDLFEKFDDVAERIKMLGYFPNASLKSYLETTTLKELNDQDISIRDSFDIAFSTVKTLRDNALSVRTEADKNDDFVTVALMEDHIATYDKELWFLASILK